GTGLRQDAIRRGDWIVRGPVPDPSARIDARIRVLADETRALRHWTPVHVHLGASSVTGRVATLEAREIGPGMTGLVQLVLEHAIGAVHGDRLILRDQSARRTIGGGRVIDVYPPARGRAKPERLDALRAMEASDPAQTLAALLERSARGLDLARFAACRNLTDDESNRLFEIVPMKRVETSAQRLAFTPAQWERLRAAALESVAAWHRRAPDSAGPPEDRILDGKGLPREVVVAVASELVREGALARSGAEVRLPSHRSDFSPTDADTWQRIVAVLDSEATRPPTVAELADRIGAAPKNVQAVLDRAARRGLALRVSQTRFFLPHTVNRLAGIVEALARTSAQGRVTAAAFRDQSGLGRNLSIEVLEFFDRVRFTRRVGDARIVLRSAEEAFSDGASPQG
ncbi:MAG: SelB C-terminal domain-containing protein, partial [Betaproteobacteria bacterium]|nr:SelB C-terminal domain-containing protein [Betaproteobacteria bacterium]